MFRNLTFSRAMFFYAALLLANDSFAHTFIVTKDIQVSDDSTETFVATSREIPEYKSDVDCVLKHDQMPYERVIKKGTRLFQVGDMQVSTRDYILEDYITKIEYAFMVKIDRSKVKTFNDLVEVARKELMIVVEELPSPMKTVKATVIFPLITGQSRAKLNLACSFALEVAANFQPKDFNPSPLLKMINKNADSLISLFTIIE